MENPRIAVFSPDPVVAARIQTGLFSAGFAGPAEVHARLPSVPLLQSLTAQGGPLKVAFLDYSDEDAALASLAALRQVCPGSLPVMANGSRRLSSLVRSKQGGAWGYLDDDYDLRALAERFGLRREPAIAEDAGISRRGKLLAFIPAQGGNGASTVALHVADRICELIGGSTLLADLDLHTGTAAFQLGIEAERHLADALATPTPAGLRESACRWKNLDILAAPPSPELVSAAELTALPLLLEAARRSYRFTILDLPAPLYASSIGAVSDADRIHIVCTAEITALHLAKRKIARLLEHGIAASRLRLLINRVGSWGAVETRHVEQITGLPAEWALDNDYPAVRGAAWRGGLVASDTPLAQQLGHLSAHLVEELGEELPAERRADAALAGIA